MNTLIIKTSFFILFLFLMGSGCKKNEDINYEGIIGKWRWICTFGGYAGVTYPEDGQTVILEFTKDSLLIESINGTTTFETNFSISGDTLKYFRGINMEYKIEASEDTLRLVFITLGLNPVYKRIN